MRVERFLIFSSWLWCISIATCRIEWWMRMGCESRRYGRAREWLQLKWHSNACGSLYCLHNTPGFGTRRNDHANCGDEHGASPGMFVPKPILCWWNPRKYSMPPAPFPQCYIFGLIFWCCGSRCGLCDVRVLMWSNVERFRGDGVWGGWVGRALKRAT